MRVCYRTEGSPTSLVLQRTYLLICCNMSLRCGEKKWFNFFLVLFLLYLLCPQKTGSVLDPGLFLHRCWSPESGSLLETTSGSRFFPVQKKSIINTNSFVIFQVKDLKQRFRKITDFCFPLKRCWFISRYKEKFLNTF